MVSKKRKLLCLAAATLLAATVPFARPVALGLVDQACVMTETGSLRNSTGEWARHMLAEWRAEHPEATPSEVRMERSLLAARASRHVRQEAAKAESRCRAAPTAR